LSLQGISPQRRYTYDANGNLAGIDDSRKGNPAITTIRSTA
jgi:hypothetical protein